MKISEYVSIGHPDKVADYISEYILDRLIEQDPKTRYALEVQVKDNYVTLGGEITTNAKTHYKRWVKEAIRDIGYTHKYAKIWGKGNTLDADRVKVKAHISKQSNDIAQGVDNSGWGDQGIFWGYSDPKYKDYMPKDYSLAKQLSHYLYWEARQGEYAGKLGLDIKTQFVLDDKEHIKKVIVAIPMKDTTLIKELEEVIRVNWAEKDTEIIINGTGTYVKHSSMGDCGTTGRKLAVDFYGGNCNVGGGSPWTKDGSKADLTLNLYARYLAIKNSKALQKPVKVSIGCCIGRKEIDITVYKAKNNDVISSYTEKKTPEELIKKFELDEPVYSGMCMFGLFGIVDELK
jgi:S-adenosylmethionine synthetase